MMRGSSKNAPGQERPADFGVAVQSELASLAARAISLEGSDSAGQDLVQETAVRALERWYQFQPQSSLRCWLTTIMHNLFLDRCRRRSVFHICGSAAALLEEAVPANETEEPPWWEPITRAEVEWAWATLPTPLRETAALVLFEGLSYKEAAARLGVGLSTLGTRMLRARVRLRTLLAGLHPGSRSRASA